MNICLICVCVNRVRWLSNWNLPFIDGIIPFLFVFVDSPAIASKSNIGRTPIRYHRFINLSTLCHGSKSFIHYLTTHTKKKFRSVFMYCSPSRFNHSINRSTDIIQKQKHTRFITTLIDELFSSSVMENWNWKFKYADNTRS